MDREQGTNAASCSPTFPSRHRSSPVKVFRWRQSVRQQSRRTERGQSITEYVLLVALVGACLALILGMVGKAASRAYHQSTVSLEQKVPNYGSSGGGGGGGVVLVGS